VGGKREPLKKKEGGGEEGEYACYVVEEGEAAHY